MPTPLPFDSPMTSYWIEAHKIAPPARPAAFTRRSPFPPGEPLAPLTLITAGPGGGKTGMLLSLAPPDEALTIWYTIEPSDADPLVFFEHLFAAVRRHIPRFGDELPALLEATSLPPAAVWQRLLAGLSEDGVQEARIVLDGVHHLTSRPELLASLITGLDAWPAGVRVLAASRRRLPFALAKPLGAGLIRLLEESACRFSPEEAARLLGHHGAPAQLPEAWRARIDALEGWPLGLALAAVEGRARHWSPEGARLGELTTYLAEELLAAQPAPRRAFMIQASLLPCMQADACREVFGVEESGDLLKALAEEHLAERLDDGESYRFTGFVRDFLQLEAARTIPADTRAGWHRRAAAHALNRGSPAAALPHLIAAEDWPGLRAVCRDAFAEMFCTGRLGLVKRWLSCVPEAVLAKEPEMLLWLGRCMVRSGQSRDAAMHFERALGLFRAAHDAAGEVRALVQLGAEGLAIKDHRQLALGHLREAERKLAVADDETRAEASLALSFLADQASDFEGVRDHCERALATPVGNRRLIAAVHCLAAQNLYTAALHRGDLAGARRALQRALDAGATWQLPRHVAYTRVCLANVALIEGEVDQAGQLLETLPAAWEDLLGWHDQGNAHTVLGHYHKARGAWAEAEASLNRARARYELAGDADGAKVPLETAMWLEIRRERPQRALAIAEEAPPRTGEGDHYDWALDLARARALIALDRAPEALAVLEGARPALSRVKAMLALTQARLLEAAAHASLGNDRAGPALAAARALIARHGYGFLERQDQRLWELLVAPDGEGGQPLRIRAFGTFEVLRGEHPIDHWPRRKARSILAALLLAPEGCSSAELAELLNPAGPFTPAILHVTVAALRRTLEPGADRRGASRYVQTQDMHYRLVRERLAFCDLDCFTEAMDAGDRLQAGDPEAASARYSEALDLYRGDLLAEPGFAELFVAERKAYRERAIAAAAWQADWLAGRGELSATEAALKRGLAIAPTDAGLTLRLLLHYEHLGMPVALRNAYWDHRKALKGAGLPGPEERLEKAYRLALASES